MVLQRYRAKQVSVPVLSEADDVLRLPPEILALFPCIPCDSLAIRVPKFADFRV